MGAYLNVITALGLQLDVTDADLASCGGPAEADPATAKTAATVRIGDYPQLRQIAWQLSEDTEIAETEALQLYERNWRHVDHAAMQPREQEFVQQLADTWSHGRPQDNKILWQENHKTSIDRYTRYCADNGIPARDLTSWDA